MEPTVKLNLSDSSDTEEDKRIIAALQSLVDSRIDAAQAAREINDTIVAATKQVDAPDAAGWQKYLWDCLGKSAMEVPSTLSAQDRLVELLQQLQQLSRQKADDSQDLWVLTPANQYRGFEQWLWTLNEGQFIGHQQVESSETAAAAYLNFSAFLARLLAASIVEATRLSALVRPSPFATHTPTKQYEIYASAAAQWIIYASDVLFEMCEKDALIEIGKQKWSRALWDSWKDKFDTIAEAEGFSSQSRTLASLAAKMMRERESIGITTDVVAKLGFMTTKDDEDEE